MASMCSNKSCEGSKGAAGLAAAAQGTQDGKWERRAQLLMMASGLDFKLTCAGFCPCLPPIQLRQRVQGLLPESGGIEAPGRSAGKVRRSKCCASSGQEAIRPEQLQEDSCKHFFTDPTQWWDSRRSKRTPRHPDFKHKQTEVALWLNNRSKPAWVESQLAPLDVGTKMTPESGSTSVKGYGAFAGHEGHLELGTCRKLCEAGRTSDAVDILDLLVQRGHVPNNLFYRPLKMSIRDKDLHLGRRIHALTVKSGYEGDAFLATHLIGLYASHGMLEEAMQVFIKVSIPDAYNWATIIFAYARHGEPAEAAEAIRLYRQMRESSTVKPDDRIYSAVLKACAAAGDLVAGKEVHAHIRTSPGKPDRFVQVGLVNMYAKCGSLVDARRLFDKLLNRDVVTWTTMIAGYAQHGMGQEALRIYKSMQQEGLTSPNSVTYVGLLQACASVGVRALDDGKQLHAQIKNRGLQQDGDVGISLVNMYAKCGSIDDARRLFNELPERSLVAWNVMIGGYAQQGMCREALSLYRGMQQEGLSPDCVTYVSLLQGCATVGVGACHEGKQLHAQIEDRGLQEDRVLGVSLVNMYAKCGSLEDAQILFDKLPEKSIVTWNAMIAGYAQLGMGQEALSLYSKMLQEGLSPNSTTYVCLLQACANVGVGARNKGEQLHAQIKERGLQVDMILGGSLVNMYAKCGSLKEARIMFDKLLDRDVVTWTAMIAGYVQQGMGQEALGLYRRMQQEGLSLPDSITYVCLLQACASVGLGALVEGKQLHAQIEERGLQADVVLGGSLVNMYAKCSSLEDARVVFDNLPERNVVAWTAMLAGYAQHGMLQEALNFFRTMEQEGFSGADSITYVCLLQACASVGVGALDEGRHLHALLKERGLEEDVLLGGSLVHMYAKCGSLEDARSVFDELPERNVVAWTTMLAGYAQQGMGLEALSLYHRMQQEGLTLTNSVIYVCLLQACAGVGVGALHEGKQLHALIEEQRLKVDMVLGGSLVNMYAKCGSLEDARIVFNKLSDKDVVTWTALIAGYAQQGLGQEALGVYRSMQLEGLTPPNSVTYVCLLQACASVGGAALLQGEQLHAEIEEIGLLEDVVVGGSLVNMYAKCGSVLNARRVFDILPARNVVTWTAMITGFVEHGMGQQALDLYMNMQQEELSSPNSVTYVCLLQACASVGAGALDEGKQLHEQIEGRGLQEDVVLGGSLVNMYAKCGSLEKARRVFDKLPIRNVVAWNAILAGYAQQGMGEEALRLYRSMQQEGLPPDSGTYVCLLQACALAAALPLGKQLHAQIQEGGLRADPGVGGAVVNMYAKCGSMFDSQQVFDSLSERTLEAWNALLGGYARQGDSDVVFDLLDRMRQEGTKPDGITFLCVLTVCSHVGLVESGREYFDAMRTDYGISPTVEHFICMVDLLGRAGHLHEALQMAKTMPFQLNSIVWQTLLGACRKWRNVEIGQHAFKGAVSVDEKDSTSYVLMSNIYASVQMWDAAKEMQARRKRLGAWKKPGQSWLTDMGGVVHTFLVGDKRCPTAKAPMLG